MDRNLAIELVRVSEFAALAASKFIGRGDEKAADQAAVDAMRKCLNSLTISGKVVIGEGERDEAPMLYIGEEVGLGGPSVDIALDPLEGTTITAKGVENAMAVIALAQEGGFLNGPDVYMEKLVVGAQSKSSVDLDAPVAHNLQQIAKCLDRDVSDLVVVVLDRERHEKLISEIRSAGARIRLIGDGDLTAAIAAAVVGSGVHAVMGSGGAPEGVIAAAAMRCLGGELYGRLVLDTAEKIERAASMGIEDVSKVYTSVDLASGQDIVFAATGVTEGSLMKGVRFFGEGCRTSSLVMQTDPHRVQFIDTVHVKEQAGRRGLRFE